MNISTVKEKLLDAVLLSERIAGKRESLPILSCILIDVDKEVTIRATNLEAGIEVRVPADISEKGTVAVPAGILSQTLRSIGRDKVTLRTEEGNLLIESKGTKTLIKAVPHNEFPALSGSQNTKPIMVAREKFMRGLQSTLYAASQSMIRPELGSVYVAMTPDGLVCVATDSFRLAEKTISKGSKADKGELLIPLKHAAELTHVLERMEGDEAALGIDESQMSVEGGSVRYVSRVIDATFPNYKEIVPRQFSTEATLLKSDLADMLRKARVFSGNEQHVGLHVYPKKKIFTATAQSPEVGEMSDTIDSALSGEDLDINFHIGYLADCLSSIEADSVVLQFAGPGRPLVIKGVNDGSFMYLVMPLNR